MQDFYKFLSILLFPFLFIACSGEDREVLYNEYDKEQIDSIILQEEYNIENLQILLERFKTENNLVGMAEVYKHLGRIHRDSSRFLEAIQCLKDERELSIKLADTVRLIQTFNNLGTNFRRMGILDEASLNHYQALQLCELYSDKESFSSKKNKVVSLNGLGNVFLSLNNNVLADSVFREALKGEEELKSNLGQAINYANLGAIFESENKIDSARIYYQLSMEHNQKAKSLLGISLCYSHFGRLYEKDNNLDKAIEQYKNAYDIMLSGSDKWHWLGSCTALSRLYIKKGDIVTAQNYLEKAKKTSVEINSLEHIADVYYLNYEILNLKKDYKGALENYILGKQYSDSVSDITKINQMQNTRVRYEREKVQNEKNIILQNYQNEKKIKRTTIIGSVTLGVIALIIILSLWYTLRLRRQYALVMQNMEKIRTNFFTNITHEFRTPLTVILGFGRQLSQDSNMNSETIKKTGELITRQGTLLLNLINQLLDISKIKSSIGEPDWHNGNIVAYIKMIAENYQDAARQKKIELSFTPKQTEIYMDFVPDYITKSINNLISNALKFTPEYGQIYILASAENNNFILNIADTGKGIETKDLPHIFDAFYRGENSNTEVGTGVGLSLVQQMIVAMKGTISVKSNLNMGTIFTITLPISNLNKHKLLEEKDYIHEQEVIEVDYADKELPKGKETNENIPMALVIEDNIDVAYYIGTQLKDKYNLFYAKNGEEGIEKAKDIMPDIIITDVMMPVMDGYEVCKYIKESEILNHIPVIMITARSTEQDKIKGIESGADAYLYKPFNATELNVRVSNLLNLRNSLREKYSTALQKGNVDEISISNSDQAFLNKFTDVIYSTISTSTINIEDLASKMFMSTRQLNRKIVSITGENTTTYILQTRLAKAKRILDSPNNKTIADIASLCGFEDGAYFSRIFKQIYGLTPTQYRRRVQ